MKNIRLLFSGLCLFLATGLGSNQAFAVDQPAPGKAKLKVERKTISKEDAAALVASGEKVTLGVWLVFDRAWNSQLEADKVDRVDGQVSFGFFDNETYTPGNFLLNPSDYIEICADPNPYTYPPLSPLPPRATCCTNPLTREADLWCLQVSWLNPSMENKGVKLGWPDYAYGNLFTQTRNSLLPKAGKEYWRFDDDGNYEFRLFDIQFVLKNASRNYPVAILDDGVQVQGALGASELNIMTGNDKYWPTGAPAAADWTGLVGSYFEFVNGGLFIENGPEVETFEPSR